MQEDELSGIPEMETMKLIKGKYYRYQVGNRWMYVKVIGQGENPGAYSNRRGYILRGTYFDGTRNGFLPYGMARSNSQLKLEPVCLLKGMIEVGE